MMTVKQLLEHCDPQQRVVVYPGITDLEQSGKVKDMLKECWYLDNEVTEFYLCAIEKGSIGIRCRQPINVDKYDSIQPSGLPRIILDMIGKMHTYKSGYRQMTGVLDLIKEKYDIHISLTRRV